MKIHRNKKSRGSNFFDWSKNFTTSNIGKYNPINYEEEKIKFFRKSEKYNPIFRYNVPPTLNPKFSSFLNLLIMYQDLISLIPSFLGLQRVLLINALISMDQIQITLSKKVERSSTDNKRNSFSDNISRIWNLKTNFKSYSRKIK